MSRYKEDEYVVTDASDEEQVEKAQAREDELADDILAVLHTSRGRRWFYNHVHGTCHVRHISYVVGHTFDAVAYNEGQRHIGENLLEEARRRAPDLYRKMLTENE